MDFAEHVSQALSAYGQQTEPEDRDVAAFAKFLAKFKPPEPAAD